MDFQCHLDQCLPFRYLQATLCSVALMQDCLVRALLYCRIIAYSVTLWLYEIEAGKGRRDKPRSGQAFTQILFYNHVTLTLSLIKACLVGWHNGNDIAIGAEGLEFDSRAGDIGHRVSNSSPPRRRFFGADRVTQELDRRDGLRNSLHAEA